jgi:hypothetical protein
MYCNSGICIYDAAFPMEHHPYTSVEPLEEALRFTIHHDVSPYVTVTHMGHPDDSWVEVIVPDDVELTEERVRDYVRSILDVHPAMDSTTPVHVLHTTFD